jgi:phasin family protein
MRKPATKPATKKVENITVDAQKTVEEGVQKMTKGIENVTAFSQENIEAVTLSSKITAKAAESMSAEIAAFSKKAYEESMAAAKDLTACKSVSELFEMQVAFGKSSIEDFVSEATKLNEMYAAAAKEAFAPLNARFTAAAETVAVTAKDYHI